MEEKQEQKINNRDPTKEGKENKKIRPRTEGKNQHGGEIRMLRHDKFENKYKKN